VAPVKAQAQMHGPIWVEAAFQAELLTKNYSIYTID
jgi:hypothetical protein